MPNVIVFAGGAFGKPGSQECSLHDGWFLTTLPPYCSESYCIYVRSGMLIVDASLIFHDRIFQNWAFVISQLVPLLPPFLLSLHHVFPLLYHSMVYFFIIFLHTLNIRIYQSFYYLHCFSPLCFYANSSSLRVW